MKNTKTITTILLLVLMAGAWMSALTGKSESTKEILNTHVSQAEEYVSRGLYQKAIEEYEAALNVENREELWTSLLAVYDKRYREKESIYSEYLSTARRAVSYYGKNAGFYIIVANLYLENEDYKNAYKYIKKAKDTGVEDEKITEMYMQTRNAYQLGWIQYTEYRELSNETYAVNTNGAWKYIDQVGSEVYSSIGLNNLNLAGSVGDENIRVISYGERTELIDGNEIIQGLLNFIPEDVGIYAEGLIAVTNNGKYSYYNSLGDVQFGEYDVAGTFIDGRAAVKAGDEWMLIDSEGNAASENKYKDIILNTRGEYIHKGIMLAKKNDKYQIYSHKEEVVGSFACDAIDIVTDDGWIAFSDGNKWGFVDMEGNIVIEPKYTCAKSFSNGYAAVSNGSLWGFIDEEGVLVIDYSFLDAGYFNKSGCCMVQTDSESWRLLSKYIVE